MMLGENKTFVGGEDYLKQKGIEVVVLQNKDCQELMKNFIQEKPGDWSVIPVLPLECPDTDCLPGMRISAKKASDPRESVACNVRISIVHYVVYLWISSKKNFRSSGFANGVMPGRGQHGKEAYKKNAYHDRD